MKYVAVSGGADSTAVALLLHERREDFEMVFSDTGVELPEVYWLLPRLANYTGKRLHVTSNGGMFQWLMQLNYFLPGPRVRWCTKNLKMVPQRSFFTNELNNTEIVHVGIRADEPKRLVNKEKEKYAKSYPLADAGYGKKEVMEICQKHDLLNPVYDWRTNVSCYCCFFQRIRDWRGLWKNHPTLFKIAEEWEEQSRLVSQHTRYGWCERHRLSDIRLASETAISLWPDEEPDSPPCTICAI